MSDTVNFINPGNSEENSEPTVGDAFVRRARSAAVEALSGAVDEAQRIVQHQGQRLLESVNAARALKERAPSNPFLLPERTIVGYSRNVAQRLQAIEIDGFLVEKYTAYDFLLMRRAAKRANIALNISSAFRSHAEQTRIYNARYTNGVLNVDGQRKGKAARPGYSTHQTGKSLDIQVGLTVAALAAGATTPTYLWLKTNAKLYGFENDVRSEPWHWTHKEDKLAAAFEDEETYANLVNAGVVAPLAIDDGRPNLALYVGRELHDRARAWSRSLEMSTASRSAIFSAQGEHAAHSGAYTSNLITLVSKANDAAGRERAPFDTATTSPLEYDFDQGTWGDKGVV